MENWSLASMSPDILFICLFICCLHSGQCGLVWLVFPGSRAFPAACEHSWVPKSPIQELLSHVLNQHHRTAEYLQWLLLIAPIGYICGVIVHCIPTVPTLLQPVPCYSCWMSLLFIFYMYVCMYVREHACRGRRLMLQVFLSCSPFCTEQGSMNPEYTDLVSWARHLVLGDLWLCVRSGEITGIRHAPLPLASSGGNPLY